MNETAVIKPHGVEEEAYPGDTIVSHHKIRKRRELLDGASGEAQVLRPAINLYLCHSSGANHSCGVGDDGTLCCPPAIVDLLRVPGVNKISKEDHPCCTGKIGPI